MTETATNALAGAATAASGPRGPAATPEDEADRRARFRQAALQLLQRTGIVVLVLGPWDADQVSSRAAWPFTRVAPRTVKLPLAIWFLTRSGLRFPASRTDDVRCREACVAALGAIGDPRGLAAVINALDDKPTVRRRATVALAGFDDPRAEPALRKATQDRDWQVRQAAEDVIGVNRQIGS